MTQLALFEEPAVADDGGAYMRAFVAGGLSHFRSVLRSWPADQRAQRWLAYYEHMRAHGYEAAQVLWPGPENTDVEVQDEAHA